MTPGHIFYPLFYYCAFLVFALVARKLLKKEGRNSFLLNLMMAGYLIGMNFGAHVLYFLVCKHSVVNQSLRDFYFETYGRLSAGGLEGGVFSLLIEFGDTAMSGLWGGPLVVVIALVVFLFFLRLDPNVKLKSLDVFAV
ncbi:MAG: hypothetical protein ACYS8W_21530, partial [Planctomycetota bacterium]